jgi:protein phosphatase
VDGSITEEEAFDHPRRNIIQQSLGMHEVIPSYERYSLQAEQKLIFCSDGLNSMVRDNEILSICDTDIPITEVVTNLVAAANDAGGHDNISCIGVNLFLHQESRRVIINRKIAQPPKFQQRKEFR